MKIAAATEDGTTISQHFGRAPLYTVVTAQDGKVVATETRSKTGHHTFAAHPSEVASGEKHGYDEGAQTRHASMMENIADCQVLIVGGMGLGARDALASRGIEVVATNVSSIEQAVQLHLAGNLPNLAERFH